MENEELKEMFSEYLKYMYDELKSKEPELYAKMRRMILTGKSDVVRDFLWEVIKKDVRPLATIVAEGDDAAADEWTKRAKAGELMRIT